MDDATCGNPECDAPARAPSATGPRSAYCSQKCRRRADYLRNRTANLERARARPKVPRTERACVNCGELFVPLKTNKQVLCSKRCASKFHRDNSGALCSVDECEKPRRARGLCAVHYKAQHPNRASWSRGNPETRRANLRRKTQLRRARVTDPGAEPIDRDAVGERDGWKCGLCSRRVDKSLAWPHPQSASLDHIVPLSRGGKHLYVNTQIAHLFCNTAKGNRGGGEQLLLIG